MTDQNAYDLTPTPTVAAVQQRAAATIRRYVPDRAGRVEVLAALGLPVELADEQADEHPPCSSPAGAPWARAGATHGQ